MASAHELHARHATKQVDRLLSNYNFNIDSLVGPWVKHILGGRTEAVIALDWTDFDKDKQCTIAAYLITSHGRATPLLWKTVYKKSLKGNRSDLEDELLERLRASIPDEVKVTVLADRGFGDIRRYRHIESLGWHYAIRFRKGIAVATQAGDAKTAGDFVPANGRAIMVKNVRVTAGEHIVPAVVCVKAKAMKEPWCIATSRIDLTASSVVKLYGRRFTIEETFRDQKDNRFGLGLSSTHIGRPDRRDRLLMLAAIAQVFLTLLGASAEELGYDKTTKVNTVKRRTQSLFRQGAYWYDYFTRWPNNPRFPPLLSTFDQKLRELPLISSIFALI